MIASTTFIRALHKTAYIDSFTPNTRWINRLEIGYLYADKFDQLSPDERFFAGAHRSAHYVSISDFLPAQQKQETPCT